MIFVIFDIEVVFMYPFAVVFRQLGGFGLVEVLVFSLTVFGALVYLVREGALSWGPRQHLTLGVPQRTSASTIVRIGVEPEQAA
jgi:NADH-quinone oxidoreductase subunit A